ncbi:D-proline reductase proprotein PrdA [Sporomusa rhizae]|uniref:glycine/sarcosine/betaine reductase component B subunit n=1 Tax=Sporomusa rhizae TaxID=357999 RepID=UPI00352AFF57
MGVGPSMKETTLHHFRDPLIEITRQDESIDLVGVAIIGSPQDNSQKFYGAERLGVLADALDVDGILIYAEGYGNQHIDFAAHMEELGKQNIPVVGLTFSADGFVVENEYMVNIIDLDKSGEAKETEIVGENTVSAVDTVRALRLLKKCLEAQFK